MCGIVGILLAPNEADPRGLDAVKATTALRRHRGRALIFLTDRYPQNEMIELNDGPLLAPAAAVPHGLRRFEARACRLAHRLPPDLVVKLAVTPVTAAKREPDIDSAALIRDRTEALQRPEFPNARVACVAANDALLPLSAPSNGKSGNCFRVTVTGELG